MYLDDADFFACRLQESHRLAHGLNARPHEHKDPLGGTVAVVVKQVVLSPGELGERVHGPLHNFRCLVVEGVDGLTRLEIHVWVLRRTAHARVVGIETARTMGEHPVIVNHCPYLLIGQQVNLVNLVRSAEPVKKMHERHACFERCRLGD